MRPVESIDFAEINSWREMRHVPILDKSIYPENGLIEPDCAAGFLTLTNSSVALLENFVSNPQASMRDREKAIATIGLALEERAKKNGAKYLVAWTQSEGIAKACLKRGYKFLCNAKMLGKGI